MKSFTGASALVVVRHSDHAYTYELASKPWTLGSIAHTRFEPVGTDRYPEAAPGHMKPEATEKWLHL